MRGSQNRSCSSAHEDKLVILDEVHCAPGLFRHCAGLSIKGDAEDCAAGGFCCWAPHRSTSCANPGKSLAGRAGYLELGPLDASEVGVGALRRLWVRGGFPDSFLAASERSSLTWRRDFIRTYLERDIPQLGPRIPADTLRRFWTVLAHRQSGLLNAAELSRALGVDGKTIARYLDLPVDLLLVRRLPPWHADIGKRLVRSPRVYVRDSGLVHSLLGLTDETDILGHSVAGASWEGFALESPIAAAPQGTDAVFYRTAAGAEIDLLLTLPGGALWAIEIQRSLSPVLARGFYQACDDLRPHRRLLVYPGGDSWPIAGDVEVLPLPAAMQALRALAAD